MHCAYSTEVLKVNRSVYSNVLLYRFCLRYVCTATLGLSSGLGVDPLSLFNQLYGAGFLSGVLAAGEPGAPLYPMGPISTPQVLHALQVLLRVRVYIL